MKRPIPFLLLGALFACVSPLSAANLSRIESPLTNTGLEPNASGSLQAEFRKNESELRLRTRKLTPATSYDFEVGGVVEDSFTTNATGEANVRFKAPDPGSKRALDFDPRGKLLRVLKSGQSVLEVVVAAEGEPAGTVAVERANLALGNAPGATGKAKADYRVDDKGRRIFKVEIEGAGAGPFELFVGGVKRGDFVQVGAEFKIKFAVGSDDAGVLVLDFDPRGEVIDILRNGEVIFSSEFAALAEGVNFSSPRLSRTLIPSTGVDPDGTAEAELRVDDRARKHFSVELEDVPVGSYDLAVDGTVVAQIAVVAVIDGTEGEVEFTSGDDDEDELPLTFDPTDKVLSVLLSGTVYFDGTFTAVVGDGSGVPAPEAPSEFEEFMASTGLDPDGTASARYRVDDNGRHKFDVELEDVPVGGYTLIVAGVDRGRINVVNSLGDVQGEIEFDSKNEPGHRLLNFDPRGQLIEITSGTDVFFSHFLGSGSVSGTGGGGGGGGGTFTEFDLDVPLLNTGADSNASARAELKQDQDGDMSFEVEIEDVNVGAYELLVSGTIRGTINVVADDGDTLGEIQFESEPGSVPLLDFDVAGQEIIIRQGGVDFFTRTFPNP